MRRVFKSTSNWSNMKHLQVGRSRCASSSFTSSSWKSRRRIDLWPWRYVKWCCDVQPKPEGGETDLCTLNRGAELHLLHDFTASDWLTAQLRFCNKNLTRLLNKGFVSPCFWGKSLFLWCFCEKNLKIFTNTVFVSWCLLNFLKNFD